jgi:predicted NBD/HSP70 family sugar kinase
MQELTIGQKVTIGVVATGHIAAGLVRGHELIAPLRLYPPQTEDEAEAAEDIHGMPMESVIGTIAQTIQDLCAEHGVQPALAGVGFPGIIRNGVIEESPNLKQGKGAKVAESLSAALAARGLGMKVSLFNDADVMAAGLAATRGQLEKLVRVWTLGHGIGFGRYPHTEGPWEGGHTVVSLDPRETYCGCGGKGHLEGIMGHRAMRLRFLDLEPDEIFANAAEKDPRCVEFESLWHRALAAASATSVHMEGPGRFFISGMNSRFIKVNLLGQYLHEMVTMTPLQGSTFEVVPTSSEIAVVGAAVNAVRNFRP